MMNRKMKDSRVEWIGKVPEEWDVQRLKNILIERKENNKPQKTDNILSLMKDRGVIPYSEKGDIGNKSKTDLTQYKLAYPGDIILNSMNVIIGSVGLSKYFGAVSPVYYMLRPRLSKDFVEYYNFVFQTEVFQKSLIGYGNGIMEHRMRIPMNNLNNVSLPVPPSYEQKAIAAFLDEKTSHIDNIIENTKKSIENLKAYKQSLITETVTKGLNTNVEMKDSGVEWVGRIPYHWNIDIAKRIFKKEQRDIDYDDIITCFRDGEVTLRKNRRTDGFTISTKEIGYQGIKKGDLVIHQMDAFAGAIGVSDSNGKSTPVYIVCTSSKDYNNYYYAYLLRSYAKVGYIESMARGIRERSTDFRYATFSITPLLVPPIKEQNDIVSYLDSKIYSTDTIITQKEKLITELETYKKSIIYEYATGKKEVK